MKNLCSTFIGLVENFTSIASKVKNLEEILTLANIISSALVSTCSIDEISSLTVLVSLLETIKTILEDKIVRLLSEITVTGNSPKIEILILKKYEIKTK